MRNWRINFGCVLLYLPLASMFVFFLAAGAATATAGSATARRTDGYRDAVDANAADQSRTAGR